jgi:hypothetical protein
MFIPTIICVKIGKYPGGQSVTAEGRYRGGRNFFSWHQHMTSYANEYLQQRYSIYNIFE